MEKKGLTSGLIIFYYFLNFKFKKLKKLKNVRFVSLAGSWSNCRLQISTILLIQIANETFLGKNCGFERFYSNFNIFLKFIFFKINHLKRYFSAIAIRNGSVLQRMCRKVVG